VRHLLTASASSSLGPKSCRFGMEGLKLQMHPPRPDPALLLRVTEAFNAEH
jgi:hypothetical protein